MPTINQEIQAVYNGTNPILDILQGEVSVLEPSNTNRIKLNNGNYIVLNNGNYLAKN